jgi:GntR family transcriptional regulator / MocR family aminotransferase
VATRSFGDTRRRSRERSSSLGRSERLLRDKRDTLVSLGPFQVGLPALDQFPHRTWSRLVARHARRLSVDLMAYGEPAGYLPLREAIANYLRSARGVHCEPEQVLIVSGSQMALRLCASVLLTSRTVACVESPGYPGAWSALQASGAAIRGNPIDGEGMVVRSLKTRSSRVRVAYVTPAHQYPLGTSMSAARRMELLAWAREHDSWIIEDDYDSEYRFANRSVGALQGIDDTGRVIFLGSFSKVLFPALRLGYMVVPPTLLERFLQQRDALDLFSPTLYQSVMSDFITEGYLARHVRRMHATYQRRRDALLAALNRRLGDQLRIVNAEAGLHLCAWLDKGVDDIEVVRRSAARGLYPIALSACFVGRGSRPGLVLGYGGSDEVTLSNAVDNLADVMGGV